MRLILSSIFILLAGCGAQSTRSTLTTIADITLNSTQQARLDYYDYRDAECREMYPPLVNVYSTWRNCMQPAFTMAASVEALRLSLIAADEAIARGNFCEALPEAQLAIGGVINIFASTGIRIPNEVATLVTLLSETTCRLATDVK